MRHFLLFTVGLIAGLILLFNLGPMLLLGISIWLLYLIFKQFMKATSTAAKVGWVLLGLIVLSIGISNVYAVIGVAAAYILYWIYQNWKEEDAFDKEPTVADYNDPFTNFESEWQKLTNKEI